MKKILLLCMALSLIAGLGCAAPKQSNAKDALPPPVFTNEKVNLVWDWQAPGEKPNNLPDRDKLPGVNVLSPKWFTIVDDTGRIETEHADKSYVKKAHEKGYRVWALITNGFDPARTSRILASGATQARIVKDLLDLVEKYDLDGINIDFENVNETDRDSLTAFVAKVSVALREKGKTVSMDVTVPSNSGNWSKCYDRKALAEYVDYVMLMAYDEHGRLSPVSGSVASLPWVEQSITATLAEVPHEKLILGMPLYMRLWEERAGKVTAKTLSMTDAETLIEEKQVKPTWLFDKGQYYLEYTEKGATYRIWQEDVRSLALKASLISRYDLAGGAFWRKRLEDERIWETLAHTIAAGE